MNPSQVSLIVPTIGTNSYLKKTLVSILKYVSSETELILFLNGTSEPTFLTEEIFQGRFKIARSEIRLPPNQSWNSAVKAASRKYIIFIGDDDLVEPSFGDFLYKMPEVDFTVLGFRLINDVDKPLGFTPNKKGLISKDQFAVDALMGHVRSFLGGVLFRRDHFFQVGGFEDLGMSNAWFLDTFLWVRLVQISNHAEIHSEPIWGYRMNLQQMGYKSNLAQYNAELDNALSRFLDLQIPKVFTLRRVIRDRLYFARVLSNVKNENILAGYKVLQFLYAFKKALPVIGLFGVFRVMRLSVFPMFYKAIKNKLSQNKNIEI